MSCGSYHMTLKKIRLKIMFSSVFHGTGTQSCSRVFGCVLLQVMSQRSITEILLSKLRARACQSASYVEAGGRRERMLIGLLTC